MTTQDSSLKDVATHMLAPLACDTILHWDGVSVASPSWKPLPGIGQSASDRYPACSEPQAAVPAQGAIPSSHAALAPMVGPICLLPSINLHAIDWETQASRLACTFDVSLLLAAIRDKFPSMTSELVWVPHTEPTPSMPFAIRPVLLIQAASTSSERAQVVLMLHLHVHDPLLHHIALVLRVTSAADRGAGRLYAEVLAEALATHLLRRYAACQHTKQECPRELAPSKLRRTVAYIHAHLEEPLPLTAIAAVAQTNPAYFARLFKQATRLTPHQYVLVCRMERAKQLLTETALPLSEISLRVGCTDQSYTYNGHSLSF